MIAVTAKTYRERFDEEMAEIEHVELLLDRCVTECRKVRRRRDLTEAEKRELVTEITGSCLQAMPPGWV